MAEKSGKRVLVTGGTGFLGSHLCERLLSSGHEVYCLDNNSTGGLENVRGILSHPRFTFVLQDVVTPFRLKVDMIYNLAAPASPVHYQADPVSTVRTCVIGAMNVLELARETGARVLQASTSEVYGDPTVHPQPEHYWGNVNPIGPRACYDEGKRCAETLCFDYRRQYGVDVRVARIFNTYGPRMRRDDGRIVSNLIVQALQGEPLTVYGSGAQTRSFCFVSDMVDGLVRLMERDRPVAYPVNLGNPEEIPVLDLATQVRCLTRSRSPILYCPLPRDDPKRRRPDIKRARRMLGWQPRAPLEQGLGLTVAYFRRLLESYVAATPRPAQPTVSVNGRPAAGAELH